MRETPVAVTLTLFLTLPLSAQFIGRSSRFGDLLVKCDSNGPVTAVGSGMPAISSLTDLNGVARFPGIHIGKYVVECPDGTRGTIEVKSSKAVTLDLTEQTQQGEKGVLQGRVFQCQFFDPVTLKPSNCSVVQDLGIGVVSATTKKQREALTTEQGMYRFSLPPGQYVVGVYLSLRDTYPTLLRTVEVKASSTTQIENILDSVNRDVRLNYLRGKYQQAPTSMQDSVFGERASRHRSRRVSLTLEVFEPDYSSIPRYEELQQRTNFSDAFLRHKLTYLKNPLEVLQRLSPIRVLVGGGKLSKAPGAFFFDPCYDFCGYQGNAFVVFRSQRLDANLHGLVLQYLGTSSYVTVLGAPETALEFKEVDLSDFPDIAKALQARESLKGFRPTEQEYQMYIKPQIEAEQKRRHEQYRAWLEEGFRIHADYLKTREGDVTPIVAFVRSSLPTVNELNLYHSLGLAPSPCDPPTDSQITDLEKAVAEYEQASSRLRDTIGLLVDDVQNKMQHSEMGYDALSRGLELSLSECSTVRAAYLQNPSGYVAATASSFGCWTSRLTDLNNQLSKSNTAVDSPGNDDVSRFAAENIEECEPYGAPFLGTDIPHGPFCYENKITGKKFYVIPSKLLDFYRNGVLSGHSHRCVPYLKAQNLEKEFVEKYGPEEISLLRKIDSLDGVRFASVEDASDQIMALGSEVGRVSNAVVTDPHLRAVCQPALR